MGRYTSIWGDRYVFVVRQRGSMKINRYVYFRLDLCVRTLADERKFNCVCYAEKGEILNRYTHERIILYLWTGREVETLTGRS